MRTQNKAGISLPPSRPNVDALLYAIAYLQLAWEGLDQQKVDLPDSMTGRFWPVLDDTANSVMDDYDRCCTLLARILCPDLSSPFNPQAL